MKKGKDMNMWEEYEEKKVYSSTFEKWWNEYRLQKNFNNLTGAMEGAFKEVAWDAWRAGTQNYM